ncbi:MAG TPA: single-stranded DNA-binding protein [Solirubrobacteraceae bacterium]|nr:single-stranded DNA-binding protein [Solirubrobacteraceae bacterium]
MIDALLAGRLYGKPQARTAKNGSAFAVGKIRVGTRGGSALFVSVITFSATAAQALLALEDGDSITIAGELTPKVWTDRDGTAHPQLDLLAHAVLSPYHVKRKREAMAGRDAPRAPDPCADAPEGAEPPAQQAAAADFDDEIPF